MTKSLVGSVVEKKISEINPDPNQPRKEFDKEQLLALADNIKSNGIINPIEIDEHDVIVTGERRWRAAKIAGLFKIPCRVVSVEGEERFLRQVSENMHQGSMSVWDTARALQRLCDMEKDHSSTRDHGIRKVAYKLGKSVSYVGEMLEILKEPKDVQEALQSKKISHSFLREIRRAPFEYQPKIKARLLKGDFEKIGIHGVRTLAQALHNVPEHSKKLMAIDFVSMSHEDLRRNILKIVPEYSETPLADKFKESVEGYRNIIKACQISTKALEDNPVDGIPKFRRLQAVTQVVILQKKLETWMSKVPKTVKANAEPIEGKV